MNSLYNEKRVWQIALCGLTGSYFFVLCSSFILRFKGLFSACIAYVYSCWVMVFQAEIGLNFFVLGHG